MSTEKPEKKIYLSNKQLLKGVQDSIAADKMTDEFIVMLQMLINRYSKRRNFSRYTYLDDMKSHAMENLARKWRGFNPERSQNAFAYFTQCIKHSFIQCLNAEKGQRNIRDKLLVYHGLSPSYSYQLDHEAQQHSNREFAPDEESYDYYQNEIREITEFSENSTEENRFETS